MFYNFWIYFEAILNFWINNEANTAHNDCDNIFLYLIEIWLFLKHKWKKIRLGITKAPTQIYTLIFPEQISWEYNYTRLGNLIIQVTKKNHLKGISAVGSKKDAETSNLHSL